MSIRWKFALTLAGLAAMAAIAASAIGYAQTRSQLLGQVDASVSSGAQRAAQASALQAAVGDAGSLRLGDLRGIPGLPPQRDDGEPPRDHRGPAPMLDRALIVQRLSSTGRVTRAAAGIRLPVNANDRAIAAAGIPGVAPIRSETIGDEAVRMTTAGVPGGGAVQVARSVSETNSILTGLRNKLALLTLAIMALAGLAGLLIARRTTRSLESLTESAERVAGTGLPEESIAVDGNDEIGRLGRAFSQMLASLAESREQQQRLVQDAGHELRTPLTSMTTNLAVLDRLDQLQPEDRAMLLADLKSETGEMAALVDELVELSAGGSDEPYRPTDVERIVRRTAERASRRTGREINVTAEAVTIDGQARSIERAVSNLLDNAGKFDQSTEPIELSLTADSVDVSDNGPGIPVGEEERIFERFHRSVEARNVPGSGLGLSIVSDIAARHGGRAYALNRSAGGATVGFSFTDATRTGSTD